MIQCPSIFFDGRIPPQEASKYVVVEHPNILVPSGRERRNRRRRIARLGTAVALLDDFEISHWDQWTVVRGGSITTALQGTPHVASIAILDPQAVRSLRH
jgi:hypothetical protein